MGVIVPKSSPRSIIASVVGQACHHSRHVLCPCSTLCCQVRMHTRKAVASVDKTSSHHYSGRLQRAFATLACASMDMHTLAQLSWDDWHGCKMPSSQQTLMRNEHRLPDTSVYWLDPDICSQQTVTKGTTLGIWQIYCTLSAITRGAACDTLL